MRYFFILSLILFTSLGYTQVSKKAKLGVTVQGTALSKSSNTPLEFIKVTLLSTKDSVVVSGAYTNSAGYFKIEKVKGSQFILKFSGFEFDDAYKNIARTNQSAQINVGEIFLQKANIQVTEDVEVIAEKAIITTEIDKKVYDPSQDLSTKGGNAIDILRNVPSVEVDEDGNISLRGNANVTILINGAPSNLESSSLSAFPANTIERVELVTNPSAKYNPDGTAGIINIVLKKNKLRGVNGNVDLTVATGNIINGGVNVNVRNEKMNLFAGYSIRHYEGFRNNFSNWNTDLGSDLSQLNQNRLGTDLNENQNLRFGGDFNLTENQTLGFSVNLNKGLRERTGDQYNQNFLNGLKTTAWNRLSRDPINKKGMILDLNYGLDFKDNKGNMKLRANSSFGENDTEGFYEQYYFNADSLQYKSPTFQDIDNKSKNSIVTLSADFTQNLKKKLKLEYGAKFTARSLDKTAFSESYDTLLMSFLPDNHLNNQFIYDEQVYALYGIAGQQIAKFGYQLGLRAEQAYTQPRLITTGETFTNNYFAFFPSVNTMYDISKKTSINLSYSRRINRPRSRTLNPFPSFSDPLNLRVGNPSLKPEFINSFELGMQNNFKKLNLTTSLYAKHTTNNITRVKKFYDDGTSSVTYINLDESLNYGLEMIASYRPFKIWKNTISGNAYLVELSDNTSNGVVNNAGFSWNMKLNSSLDLFKKTTTIQLTTRYMARRVSLQGYVQPKAGIDISIQRRFFNKKLTVGARVSDVFNNKGFELELTQGKVTQFSEFKWQTRRLYLNASYRFGKLESKKGRKGKEASDFDF